MSDIEPIPVEVVYALPHKQKILELLVKPGTTALQAAQLSGITRHFPELELASATMGIFGQTLGVKDMPAPASYELQAGDRVEIYRPLISDPKEVRMRVAARQKAAKEQSAEQQSVIQQSVIQQSVIQQSVIQQSVIQQSVIRQSDKS